MEISVKTRLADSEHIRIYINVHDGGKHPVERPSVKGVKIKKKYWNDNGNADKMNWIKTTHSDYPKLNQQIFDKLTEVEAKYKGQDTKQVIEDRERAITGGRKVFLRYAEQFISERRNASTKANDLYGIQKLKEYLEEQDNVGLQFKEITKQFVREYYKWLLKSVKPGSANQYLNTFRTIFNAADEDERVQIKVNLNPFEKLKKEKVQRKSKNLTIQEVTMFRNFNIPQNKPKWLEAKHMFLFQFSGGYRVRDVLYLRWKDLRKTDRGIIWDNYTNKTTNKLTRTLTPEVQLLLLPCLQRYYPAIEEVVIPMKEEINILKIQLQEEEGPKEMSVTEMLNLMKSGSTLHDVEEQILKNSESRQKLKALILEKQLELEGFLSSKIIDLSFDKSDDYVWSYGNRKGFTRDVGSDEEKDRVLQSVSSYDRFLDVLAKKARIRTHISSHVARHTATVHLLRGGVNPEEVSKFLGHSRLPTLDFYRNLDLDDSNLVNILGDQL